MKNKPIITIIGFGRFGKLLAKILAPYGQINVIHRKKIKSARIKQIDYPDLVDTDWLIPAVPISALEEVLRKTKPYLSQNAWLWMSAQ